MNKITYCLLLLLFAVGTARAQAPFTADSIPASVNRLFATLNTAQITTGILIEKGVCFADPTRFSPRRQNDTADLAKWLKFRQALRGGRYGNILPQFDRCPIDSVFKLFSATTVPIGVIYTRYNSIKAHAMDLPLPAFLPDTPRRRYIDNPLRIDNPYNTDTLIMVSPIATQVNLGLTNFVLSADWFFSNLTQPVALLMQVDFGDGKGFQTVLPGVPVPVEYTSPGDKLLQYRISNGLAATVLTKSTLHVTSAPSVLSQSNTAKAIPACFSAHWDDTWHDPMSGCEAYIKYATNKHSITHPIILAEGFDALDEFNCDDLWDFVTTNAADPTAQYQPAFLYSMTDKGYDIVVLNFIHNGGKSMVENAEVMKRLIREMNARKAASGSTASDVIGGISMGAVIARYALSDMEQNCEDPEEELYVSYDGPHKGVNINPGFQFLTSLSANNLITLLAGGIDLLNQYFALKSDAARQLAKAHFTNYQNNYFGPDPMHIAFYNQLNGMGNPKCRKIGISLGHLNNSFPGFTENGAYVNGNYNPTNIGFDQRDRLLHTYLGNFFYNVDIQLYAQSTYTAPLYRIDHGTIAGNQQIYGDAYADQPWDNAPGGQWRLPYQVAHSTGGTTDGRNYSTLVPLNSAWAANSNTGGAQDVFSSDYSSYFFNDLLYHYGWNVHENLAMTPRARDFIIDQLDNHFGSLTYGLKLNAQQYNAGPLTTEITRNVQALNNSAFYVNANMPTGLAGSGGTGPNPLAGSTLNIDVKKGFCRNTYPTVTINASRFELGEPSGGRKANVNFKTGTTLYLQPNSTLVINQGSTLTIEEGATLSFGQGAHIQLNGTDAMLTIKGMLQLEDNATFDFTGEGLLVFNNPHTAASVTAGSQAKIKFDGGLFAPRRIYVRQPELEIECPMEMNFCDVTFAANSLLSLESNVKLYASNFLADIGAGFYNGHRGVQTSTPLGGSVTYCNFSGGANGLLLYGATNYPRSYPGATPFLLHHCNFNKNDIGFHVMGNSVFATDLNFTENNYSVYMEAMSYFSTLNNITVSNNDDQSAGIFFSGLNWFPGYLSVGNSQISNCINGIEVTDGNVNVFCSKINSNQNGFKLNSGGRLDLTTDLVNPSYITPALPFPNICTNNQITIKTANAQEIVLKDGGNNLIPTMPHNQRAINGTMNATNCQPGTIDATGNSWNNDHNFSNDYFLSVMCAGVNGGINVTDNAPVTPVTQQCSIKEYDCAYDPYSCFVPYIGTPQPPVGGGSDGGHPCANCPVISTLDFDHVTLDAAVGIAGGNLFASGGGQHFTTGFQQLGQILGAPVVSSDVLVQQQLSKAVNLMEFAFAWGLAQGRISTDPNQNDAYVKLMIKVQDDMIAPSLTSGAGGYGNRLLFTMKKVQTYLTSNHFAEAEGVLNGMQSWVQAADQAQVDRMTCIVRIFGGLYSGAVHPYQIQDMLDACAGHPLAQRLAGAERPADNPQAGADKALSTILYPNPLRGGVLNVRLYSTPASDVHVTVVDLSGRELLRRDFAPGNREIRLTDLRLAAGSYLLKVDYDGKGYAYPFTSID